LHIQGCGREHRRRDVQTVRSEIFEQGQWQRQRGNCSRRRCADCFIDAGGFASNGLQGISDNRTCTIGSGARDKVDQLAPSHRRVVPILSRLVEDGQQTIVEPHLIFIPLRSARPALGERLLCAKWK
jgi:hypothetical protein